MKTFTFLKDTKDQNSRYEKWVHFMKNNENKMIISDLFWLSTIKFYLFERPDA